MTGTPSTLRLKQRPNRHQSHKVGHIPLRQQPEGAVREGGESLRRRNKEEQIPFPARNGVRALPSDSIAGSPEVRPYRSGRSAQVSRSK